MTTPRRPARARPDAGFTLIELLVTVVVIGLLAGIAVPVYLGVQNRSREAAVRSDLTNDRMALLGYASATGATGWLDAGNFTTATLGTYGFVNPSTGAYTTPVAYAQYSAFTSFCIWAQSATGTYVYASTRQPATTTTDQGVASSCNNWWNW